MRGLARELGAHRMQHAQRRGLVLVAQARHRGLAGPDQFGGVRMPAVAAGELRNVIRLQRLALQFPELVLEPGNAVADVALAGQLLALAQQGAPLARGLAHRGERRLVAAEGIQQRELAGARQQRLVLVLAVDLDQQRGQFRELGHGRRAPVDPGARAAVGAQGAPQLALAAIVELGFAQPRQRVGRVVERELGDQLGARGAVADHAAVGAQPGQEAEGVDQQRLAGAGLAGNHGEAGPEFQFGDGDDGEVADGQAGQHRNSVRDRRRNRCACDLRRYRAGAISRAWPKTTCWTRARGSCYAR